MDDLDNDIAQAMAGHEAVEQTEEVETEEVLEPIEATSEPVETEDTEELTAPINWDSETREYFNSLDDNGKQLFSNHYKNLERGYNKKYEDVARQRKTYESVTDVFAPIRNEFMQAGLDEAGAARYLVSMYQQIAQDPETALRNLAEQMNVDLSPSYDYDYDSESYDPRYDSIQNELKETRKQLEAFQSQAKQSQLQQVTNQINAFKSETDSAGNLKHPFFDQVEGAMTHIFQAGAATTIEQAYKMAVAADSELSAKQIQLIREQEAREKTKAAKQAEKAARRVKGSSSTSVEPNGTTDLRDMIAEQVRAARRS